MKDTYVSLKLTGARANSAVECMRKEGVMPAKAPYAASDAEVDVFVDKSGHISIAEPSGHGTWQESVMSPAEKGNPAKVVTPDIEVVGQAAEKFRQKAISCAVKGLGLKP